MSTPRNIGPEPSRGRRIARVVSAIGTAALAGTLAGLVACTDAPSTAPATPARPLPQLQGPAASLTSTLTGTTSLLGTVVNGLLWSAPATQATASRVIGPDGGSFAITDGIRVTVPKGAVASNVAFSVTRLPGLVVAYEFQPHGIKFAVPVQVQQPTAGTSLLGLPSTASVQAAYFPDASTLNQLLGTVVVTEFRPTALSADRAWLTFTVDHFSGYVVAWGRQ